MDQQVPADLPESDTRLLREDSKDPQVPHRCMHCQDSVLCDFDYCLHWWH